MKPQQRIHWAVLVLAGSLIGTPGASAQTVAARDVFPGESWENYEQPEDAGYSSEKLQAIRQYVIDEMHTTGLVIVVGGKVLGQFGDVEELSYLASCRKSVLAMLYGKYVQEGVIDLDRTLADLGMNDVGGLLPIEKTATVRHLITARSGVYHPASNGGDSSADAPERGSQKPGEYFLYNNWDFNAAGAAFELMTKKNIYDALQEDLAAPIGMQDFDRFAQTKTGDLTRSQYPAYHVWLSTRDMARLGHLMLREGNWKGRQVVSKKWIREMVGVTTPVSEMNPPKIRSRGFGYGTMWWLWDGPQVKDPFVGGYTAKGYMGQYITILPKLDLVVAHKTKSDYGRFTSWQSYVGFLERLIDARLEGNQR